MIIIIYFTWHFIPPLITQDSIECSKKYPLKDIYSNLHKTHDWKIYTEPFREIEIYISNLQDGLSIYCQQDNKDNDIYIGITNINSNKWDGFSINYLNGKLSSVHTYKEGKKEGIHLSLHNNYPSLVVVYSDNKNMGLIGFWDYGRIRGIKFGSNYKDETRESGKDNDTYDNGQKAFEYLEENGTEYWAVYNPKGQMLIKYPTDNDFCKVEFYENGKKVEIPYYFDQKEFEEIYEKIKHDVNKS